MKSLDVWPLVCFTGDGVTVGDKAVKGLWRPGVPSGVPAPRFIEGKGYEGVDTWDRPGVGGTAFPRTVKFDSVDAVWDPLNGGLTARPWRGDITGPGSSSTIGENLSIRPGKDVSVISCAHASAQVMRPPVALGSQEVKVLGTQ